MSWTLPSGQWPDNAPPSPPPPPPRKRGWPWWLTVLVVLGAVSVGAAIIGAATGQLGDDGDSAAATACNRFRSAAGDYSDGVLSLAELRVRFQSVNDAAQDSDSGDIKRAARDLLAAISGDPTELPAAIEWMDTQCSELG